MMRRSALALLTGAVLIAGTAPATAAPAQTEKAGPAGKPVLLISIDGLRPGDVLEAEQRGLNVPNLRRFLKEGAYATGVTGVLPTVTYPSHTTLLTGVAPARHGIVSNQTFDPTQINYGGWYWYAQDVRARTLWDAAKDAGLTTGNVHWPVSVGVKSLDWNLPQIWRSGHPDDRKLLKALATDGLVDALEHDCGAYADGIDESITGDETRAKFGVGLIAQHKPGFVTVYLTALDHEQHAAGPGSATAHAVLERIDALVGTLVAAEMAAHPDAAVAVVSDHGFAATDTEVNLFRAFIDAGLMTLDAQGKVSAWDAVPWPSGGSAAVVLARPEDAALVAKVRALLDKLAANPAMKIAHVAEKAEVAVAGGNPQASYYIDFRPGAVGGPFEGASAPLTRVARVKGMHGYFPGLPDMRSTFLVMGKGVARGKTLGQIDMRAIAPTLAALMQARLPAAEVAAVDLAARPTR